MKVKPAAANTADAPSDLGPRLRAIRLRRGIGLRELARRLDLSPSSISQIETGKIRPSVRTLYALASEFGVTVDEVLFNEPPPAADADVSPSPESARGRAGAGTDGPARRRASGDHAQLRCQVGAAHVLERRGRRVPRGDVRARRRVEPRRLVRPPQRARVRVRAQRDAPGRRRVRRVHPRAR